MTSPPSLSLRDITVRFGGVTALDNVSLDFLPGRRHAVVGENGAGKSTLLRVLFGEIAPGGGAIEADGAPRLLRSPADALAAGIGMVPQHLDLIGPLSVAENITLGDEPRIGFRLDRARRDAEIAALAERHSLPIDPSARVDTLSLAAQQRVEILKALRRRACVLLLDEPTAALAPPEARELWTAVDHLAAEGATIVFVTHQLADVMAHADDVTVLRRGRRILSVPVAATTPAALAAAMIGENVTPTADSIHSPATVARDRPALSVRGLTTGGRVPLDGADLDLYPGEIVGLAGVDGSGQAEWIEAILGLRPATGGAIFLDGVDITHLPIAARRARGIGYIPEDRHRRGLALPLSVAENAILGRQREPAFAGRSGILRRSAIRAFVAESVAAFDIRGASPDLSVRHLSGGNQQKLVLARELSRKPAVLLAAQPTRGLDFAATRFVHDSLRAARGQGAALAIASLDLTEILALADRIAVFYRGRIVAVLDRSAATEERLGAWMTGAAGG